VSKSFFVGNAREGILMGARRAHPQLPVFISRAAVTASCRGSIIAANREDGVRIDDTFGALAPSTSSMPRSSLLRSGRS